MRSYGLDILGYLGGYRSSSSRIELVGVILSIMSNLPVHFACDNLSVLRRAQYYTDHLRQHDTQEPPGKPSPLLKNGNLWAIFYNSLRARGPHSFCIKNTKGHALADGDFLGKFPQLRTEAQHNNEAVCLRIDGYVNFVRLIHNIIYRMQLAIRDIKAAPALVATS